MKKVIIFAVLAAAIFFASFSTSYIIVSNVTSRDKGTLANSTNAADKDTVRITVSVVGDCTLGSDVSFGAGGSFDSEFSARGGDYSYFLSGVKEYFESDDLTIVNLEGPLSERGDKADKKYAFRGKSEYVKILSMSSVEAANLANNHAMDYGKTAYKDTKDTLSKNGITPFGADDVRVVDIKGIKVGLIGTSALNSLQRAEFSKNLEKLKSMEPDIIIASFHWGAEKAIKANKGQIALAHSAIDSGADLVIGHHPHVLQGIENYKGKYIVYSLGNFCFGGNKSPDDKDTMIFKQTFTFKKGILTDEEEVCVIPCSISSSKGRNDYRPKIADKSDYKRLVKKIVGRSSDYTGIENVSFK